MTARRKDDGTLEVISSGLGSNTFRIFVTFLLLSMHPIGRGLLDRVGFEFPDSKQREELVNQTATLRYDIIGIKKTVSEVHNDIAAVKVDVDGLRANAAITQAKLDKLSSQQK